ncbi:putative harbinger transposase-derived nuclease [Abeliophyllum distichum]|uniref:Harbinger transposase-derived nuclease n=1 Tax=Abeliophyllum distichum TaxID=126358 RepID=A0ABD1Q7D0_9LAMI
MNPNLDGPSYSSSIISSSSSDGDNENEEWLTNDLAAINEEHEAISRLMTNNNLLIAHYLDQQQSESVRRGSTVGHVVINRDRENANTRLFNDYFADNSRYNESMFRRRFQMSRNLFLRIVQAVEGHDKYFNQKRDGVGKLGLSAFQKITAVFRMLAYGVAADATDEYIKIGESTAIESLKRFCRAIVEVFADQYLRSPNANDIARLLHIGKQHGFPGMLGSLDCMHWKWKNCPTGWAGQYTGSNNDINVLEASHLFANLAQGIAPPANYVLQRQEYNTGYYLADGWVEAPNPEVEMVVDDNTRFQEFLGRHRQIKNKEAHIALRNALIDHLWDEYTNSEN